jgi:glutamate dehydrogenase
MSHTFEKGKDELISAFVSQLKQKLAGSDGQLCAEFARQFFMTVALDDLQAWSIDDMCGIALNLWSMMKKRAPGETKIRIYNPDEAHDGWQSSHTVVQVICDDMPFLVDSLRIVINRMGMALHLIVHMGGIRLKRGASHEIEAILPRQSDDKDFSSIVEAPIFLEIDRETDPEVLNTLLHHFEQALEDNRAVVEDWMPMRARVRDIIDELDNMPARIDVDEVNESKAFLNWIEDHHFTFLGVRDYELVENGGEMILKALPGTGLGLLRETLSQSHAFNVSLMAPEARELTLSSQILIISKTNTLASVHRNAYTDYIGVKRFNEQGEVIGERRILGLYTSVAYNTNPKHIPFLRHKVAQVMHNSQLSPRSHAAKVLLNILETLPRDDLMQASEDELLDLSKGIFYMQERRRIRLFARMDVYHRFISCLVYVPKDLFNSDLRKQMEVVLKDCFNALEITFSTLFTESMLARIHFIVRIDPHKPIVCDFKTVEQKLIEVGRSWVDDFQALLFDAYGEEKANELFHRYKSAFPAVYRENFPPEVALLDIREIENLSDHASLGINFYQPEDDCPNNFRLKIYQHDNTIPLSDVLPIIEKLGLRAISERPYALKFDDGRVTWINEFFIHYTRDGEFKLEEIKTLFQNAFRQVWFGLAENDGFNQLVLAAGLDWRQVSVLRLYAKYFKQIGFTFSQDYIESALNNNTAIAKKLVQLFECRFNPVVRPHRDADVAAITAEILEDLDAVDNLDEDKIIRQFIQAMSATLRTSYYQLNDTGNVKPYISIKLNSKAIPGVPKPHPLFEIFVYAPRFEGVHLRCEKVARGGLRWSDRREDFRTEVLGLMKAQQVKNAVIVPSGAKGGFVPKQIPVNATREEISAEGIACYQYFIRSLLDITDNYINGVVSKPLDVICYDEDDPYLVVAADKGTATFSDLANAISLEYKFWLGDAFASGGSVGYDHKKMGITARGAWESVKRHFYQLGVDINTTDFTVVGIGDMAGDVFGNGMLLSKHIKLVAAFNHMHIFIDPSPDPAVSFEERERLFNLPRSTWADYDKTLISKGGGVFNRNVKSIVISKEMKQVFGIKQAAIEPNELIKLILKAKFDLLWSAGIGTFVKAQSETNVDVGDRSNDLIRINGKQLRCRVVGEGGNLGLTQLGRIEYALNGGQIYTDFIDNSAGVSCSDKEVNIKILLNGIVDAGELTLPQRVSLLSEMTHEVAALVLRENYSQTRAISLSETQAARSVDLHSRYLNELGRIGKLDRRLEFLPEEKSLLERKMIARGLTTPEISVLLCYSKIVLKEAILESDVPEERYLKQYLIASFPKPLQERFSAQMESHPLKREIIATRLSNMVVNEMGFSFVYRLQDETGASMASIVRAYIIARSVLGMDAIWAQIEALENQISAQHQSEILVVYVRLLRRISRWFLRNQRMRLDIAEAIKLYEPGVCALKNAIPELLSEGFRKQYDAHMNDYRAMGIPDPLAHELTITRGLFVAMDVIEVARNLNMDVTRVAQVYFGLGDFLELEWIRTQIITHPTENHWESLSREALRDDLDWQQRQLTASIIRLDKNMVDVVASLSTWAENNAALIERWRYVLANLRSSNALNYTMFFVAIRELLDLTQTTLQLADFQGC